MSGNNISSFPFYSSSSSSFSSDDDGNTDNNDNLDCRMINQEWRPSGLLKSSSTSNSLNFLVTLLMYTFLLVLFFAPTTTRAATTATSVKNGNVFSSTPHENLMNIPHSTLDRLESKLTTVNVNGSPSSSTSSSSPVSSVSDSSDRFQDLNLIPNENNPHGKSQYSTSSSKSTSSLEISGQIRRLLNWKRQLGRGLGHRILRQTRQQVHGHETPEADSGYWHSKEKKGFSVISRLYPYIVGNRDQQTLNRKELSGLQQRSFVNEEHSPMIQMRRSSNISSQRPYRFRLRWG